MMKFKNIYALIAVVLFATACQDDELVPSPNNKPAEIGDEIVFGGRAGFENGNPDSRTVYSGEIYQVDNVKFERIDWTEGDKIEIYSPEAANGPTSHYQINNWSSGNEDDQSDYTYLTREGDSGLQWGTGSDEEGTHHFYAMYPSSKMFDANSESNVASGVKMEGTIVKGIIPIKQDPIKVVTTKVTDANGKETGAENIEALPNMNFAYMVARSTATREKGSVDLTFVPIVTAVKVTMTLPETTTNNGVTSKPQTVYVANVRVEGKGIAGSFSADLDETKWTGIYPSCTNSPQATDQITLSLWQTVTDESGNETTRPLSVKAGGQLTFTVFMLPGADINSLKVSFDNGGGYVGKTLAGTSLFPKHKKTVINGLQLPVTGFTPSYGNWMSQLVETTPFARLSIPGAGAAFSKGGSNGYKAQTLSFDELWNKGIRAFEIITDRQAGTNFGNESVRCNNQAVSGTTVASVLKDVVDNLSDSEECAVLIFTYQPTGNQSYKRNPETYVNNLCGYFEKNYTDYLVKYRPDLTLKDAKGKIIVIVRPSQLDEDTEAQRTAAINAANESAIADKILIVDGCGTAKDKWGTRGYSNNETASPEQGNVDYRGRWETNNVEYSIVNNTWNTVTKVNAEYNYGVNIAENEKEYQIWYQEWARVVPDSDKDGVDDVVTRYSSTAYWRDSYNEKLNDAKKAFDMALSGEYDGSIPGKGPYVFVNVLSGFYTTTASGFSNSYLPLDPTDNYSNYAGGSIGDIQGLSTDLNEAFYQYVLSKKDQTGATGIVMMDFVANQLEYNSDGVTPKNAGSFYLPGVIINNNYMFNTVEVPEAPAPGGSTDKEEDA